MKVKNCLVILAGSAIVLASSGRSFAQTQLTRDGYAVTPKIRQMTENGGTAGPAMGGGEVIVGESPGPNVVVARSPEQQAAVYPPAYYESQHIGYKTTWDDGIAASPRLRQMMMENRYPMRAMGGSEFISGESARPIVSTTDNRSRRVGYAAMFDYGIAAPPRAWKMMVESPANPQMSGLR